MISFPPTSSNRWRSRKIFSLQEEQSRWTREKQILQAGKEGLEQEIKDLEESIATAKARIETLGAAEKGQLEKKRQNDAAREVLTSTLAEAEAEACRVIPLLPGFYMKENTKLAAAVDALQKSVDDKDGEKKAGLGARLSTVALILSEAEKFQTRSWGRDEERQVDGRSMLVTTLYFGLSTAFCADELQTVALRGSPDENGWKFESLPEKDAPAKIRRLIEVATLKGEIGFVEVPLEVR